MEVLDIDGEKVTINPENLKFNEESLGEYIQKEASFYDNFGYYLARAEKLLQIKELAHEKLYMSRFVEAKDYGASDKLAEAKAKADLDVISVREEIIDVKYMVQRIKRHLLAWDKNHENAQSMGHTLRKQMDKLNAEIYSRTKFSDMFVEHDHPAPTKAAPSDAVNEFEDGISADNLF